MQWIDGHLFHSIVSKQEYLDVTEKVSFGLIYKPKLEGDGNTRHVIDELVVDFESVEQS